MFMLLVSSFVLLGWSRPVCVTTADQGSHMFRPFSTIDRRLGGLIRTPTCRPRADWELYVPEGIRRPAVKGYFPLRIYRT